MKYWCWAESVDAYEYVPLFFNLIPKLTGYLRHSRATLQAKNIFQQHFTHLIHSFQCVSVQNWLKEYLRLFLNVDKCLIYSRAMGARNVYVMFFLNIFLGYLNASLPKIVITDVLVKLCLETCCFMSNKTERLAFSTFADFTTIRLRKVSSTSGILYNCWTWTVVKSLNSKCIS